MNETVSWCPLLDSSLVDPNYDMSTSHIKSTCTVWTLGEVAVPRIIQDKELIGELALPVRAQLDASSSLQ